MLTLKEKIVKIFAIFLLLFILIVNHSYALVKQSTEFFVNDTSNVLTQDTKEYIININKELESKTGAQIVVVTVKTLDGLSVEDYAIQLARNYRYW
ncbi:MAG: TPM domain-containing protein [Clostridia bacterium]|nr:TPM domain-containing protein [Clostridia bacterium]